MNLFYNFYERRNNIITKTQNRLLSKHDTYVIKKEVFHKTITQMYCLLKHISFIQQCELKFSKAFGYNKKILHLWSKTKELSNTLEYESQFYCIYKSQERRKMNTHLITALDKSLEPMVVNIKNCNDIFTCNNKEYFSSIVGTNTHLHLSSKTSVSFENGLVQRYGDSICLDYFDIFYCRDITGNIQKKVYRGISPEILDELKYILNGELSNKKVLKSLGIIGDLKNVLKTGNII